MIATLLVIGCLLAFGAVFEMLAEVASPSPVIVPDLDAIEREMVAIARPPLRTPAPESTTDPRLLARARDIEAWHRAQVRR